MLVKLLMLVLERVPSDCEELSFPSCTKIHFPYDLLCSVMCSKPEVILVFVWLIIEYSLLALIFVPGVVTNSYPLGVWSLSDFPNSFPWLQSSSIVPRHPLRWLSVVVLNNYC
jgi:hypothetical protein